MIALPIIDEDSGNVLGHIIADRIRLISVLNDAGLTEVSSAIAALPAGTTTGGSSLKGSAAGTAGISGVDVNVQSGIQYDWWGDDSDNSAGQIYIPLNIKGFYKNYSAALLSGFAHTSVDLSDGTSESLSGLLDTKINMTYEMAGKLPVNVLVGLDFNLPTGKTDLTDGELVLIEKMDPDLISINTFGEGFNINPTVTAVKQWEDMEAGIGIGYVWRGEYDYSEDLTSYDPGNIINASTELRYNFSIGWVARVFGYFAHYGKDKADGEDLAQEGTRYLFGMGVNYDNVAWVTGAAVRAVFRDKLNKFQESTGGSSDISQGNEWIGDLFFTYNLNIDTVFRSSLQGLYIGENDQSSDSDQFIGDRKKFTLGAGVTRTFVNQITVDANIKGFIMNTGKTRFPEVLDSTSYKGLTVMVLANRGF